MTPRARVVWQDADQRAEVYRVGFGVIATVYRYSGRRCIRLSQAKCMELAQRIADAVSEFDLDPLEAAP